MIKTKFKVDLLQQGKLISTKLVDHLHFISWPDHGVPKQPSWKYFTQLAKLVEYEFISNKIPVIHCSAGVGRTGTLIGYVGIKMAIDVYFRKLKNKSINPKENSDPSSRISIFSIVRRLRE